MRSSPSDTKAVGLETVDEESKVDERDAAEAAEVEVDALRREAAEMRELAQRKQAELENYRRRVERERADLLRHAGFEVVKEVLPVLDNLERALQASESSPEESFRAGVAIICRQFREILTRQGLSEVESEGRTFDPHVHEAVTRIETSEHPEGTVVEVLQKGYLFKDRLLRPAMVSVAQAPEAESGSESEEREGREEAAGGAE